eukprot:scaffold122056_cov27-Tisochrysis_lutea.AAC.2
MVPPALDSNHVVSGRNVSSGHVLRPRVKRGVRHLQQRVIAKAEAKLKTANAKLAKARRRAPEGSTPSDTTS